MIPLLAPEAPFPAASGALTGPYNGLLAATEHLESERLLAAYRLGVFPWYAAGEPVLWWTPDPRMVLYTAEFKVSRSLRKRLRAVLSDPDVELRVDGAFERVMRCCAAPRAGQPTTWITDDVLAAYGALHRRRLAHSVEVWRRGTLVGGLYGVAIGRMFYGESMFAWETDASKIALFALVRILLYSQVPMIDCQQNTSHLASMGAREIPRPAFCDHVAKYIELPGPNWDEWSDRSPRGLSEALRQFVASPGSTPSLLPEYDVQS